MQEAYRLDESDRVLQKTPYSFDVSLWEFFWPLRLRGAAGAGPPGRRTGRGLPGGIGAAAADHHAALRALDAGGFFGRAGPGGVPFAAARDHQRRGAELRAGRALLPAAAGDGAVGEPLRADGGLGGRDALAVPPRRSAADRAHRPPDRQLADLRAGRAVAAGAAGRGRRAVPGRRGPGPRLPGPGRAVGGAVRARPVRPVARPAAL